MPALFSCVAILLFCGPSAADDSTATVAERLGYAPDAKLLIVHADDVGMCHSVNAATISAMEQGAVTSASIMVPCPWMPEVARYCREHPDADFGLHLTLTSEWQVYRWRPVTAHTEVPGLLDDEGFLHRDVPAVVESATSGEVAEEIKSQIRRARAFGIQPTHVDSHMGTLFTEKFYTTYVDAARAEGVMPMLIRPTVDVRPELEGRGILNLVRETTPALEKEGFVFLDFLNTGEKGDTLEERRQKYFDFFRGLKPGVNEVIVHLAMDDEEIRHVTNNWRARWIEYQIFSDPRTRQFIESLGIKLIGYKDLRRLFTAEPK
jgi:hypothetical protein